MDAFLVVGMLCYLSLGGVLAFVAGELVRAPRVSYEVVDAL